MRREIQEENGKEKKRKEKKAGLELPKLSDAQQHVELQGERERESTIWKLFDHL